MLGFRAQACVHRYTRHVPSTFHMSQNSSRYRTVQHSTAHVVVVIVVVHANIHLYIHITFDTATRMRMMRIMCVCVCVIMLQFNSVRFVISYNSQHRNTRVTQPILTGNTHTHSQNHVRSKITLNAASSKRDETTATFVQKRHRASHHHHHQHHHHHACRHPHPFHAPSKRLCVCNLNNL